MVKPQLKQKEFEVTFERRIEAQSKEEVIEKLVDLYTLEKCGTIYNDLQVKVIE